MHSKLPILFFHKENEVYSENMFNIAGHFQTNTHGMGVLYIACVGVHRERDAIRPGYGGNALNEHTSIHNGPESHPFNNRFAKKL